MKKELINFIDISKSYNGNLVLDDLNLYVREMEKKFRRKLKIHMKHYLV